MDREAGGGGSGTWGTILPAFSRGRVMDRTVSFRSGTKILPVPPGWPVDTFGGVRSITGNGAVCINGPEEESSSRAAVASAGAGEEMLRSQAAISDV